MVVKYEKKNLSKFDMEKEYMVTHQFFLESFFRHVLIINLFLA
jgi:hypothetical protein